MPEPKATKSTPPGEAKPGSSTPLLELLAQYRRELTFIEPPAEARRAISGYVRERLSLPA